MDFLLFWMFGIHTPNTHQSKKYIKRRSKTKHTWDWCISGFCECLWYTHQTLIKARNTSNAAAAAKKTTQNEIWARTCSVILVTRRKNKSERRRLRLVLNTCMLRAYNSNNLTVFFLGVRIREDTRIHSLTDAGLKALAPLQSDRRYRRWTWTIATIYQTEGFVVLCAVILIIKLRSQLCVLYAHGPTLQRLGGLLGTSASVCCMHTGQPSKGRLLDRLI